MGLAMEIHGNAGHENYWLEIRDFDFLLPDVSRFRGIFEI